MNPKESSGNSFARWPLQAGMLGLLWTGCIAASFLWNLAEQGEERLAGGDASALGPRGPLWGTQARMTKNLVLAHGGLWVLGLAGIGFSSRALGRHFQARQRAEQALRESDARRKIADAVHAERQRFNSILDILPAYVVLLSPDYHVPFANRFFEERFGKSNGKRCFEYLFQRTEPCENCETYKVLKTHSPHRWEWTGPDGRNYDIYDFPFTDADGSPLIMEMGIDITERKQAEAALREAHETLEQRVAQRTAELRAGNEELGRLNRAMTGRELRMIELKKEINEICRQAGRPPRYPLDFESSSAR